MRRQLPAAAGMLLLFTVLLGLVYPLVVTGIAQVAFHDKANGSLVEVDGTVVKTNSAYAAGNRVTYMDMDFGALLADQKAFKEFGEGMEGSLAQQKAALAKVKGMKVHLEPQMVVEFKAN